MARKDIGPSWDRRNLNAMNDNFEELYVGVDRAADKAMEAIGEEFDAFKAEQAEDFAAFKAKNDTRFLDAVATVSERDSKYPKPANGDTVRVTGEAAYYRYEDGRGWVKTDQYNPAAIDQVNQQLADTAEKKADKGYTDEQLSLKRDRAEKLKLEDLSADALAAIEGGEGTTFNLLSVPQDLSVSKTKVDPTFLKELKAPVISGDTDFVYENGELMSAKEVLNGQTIREQKYFRTSSTRTSVLDIDTLAGANNIIRYQYGNDGETKSILTLQRVKSYPVFNHFLTMGLSRKFGTTMNLYSTDPMTPLDLSAYKERAYLVRNTHNAPLVADVYGTNDMAAYPYLEVPTTGVHTKLNLSQILVPAKTDFIIDDSTLEALDGAYTGFFLMLSRTQTAPTEGNVEVLVYAK